MRPRLWETLIQPRSCPSEAASALFPFYSSNFFARAVFRYRRIAWPVVPFGAYSPLRSGISFRYLRYSKATCWLSGMFVCRFPNYNSPCTILFALCLVALRVSGLLLRTTTHMYEHIAIEHLLGTAYPANTTAFGCYISFEGHFPLLLLLRPCRQHGYRRHDA